MKADFDKDLLTYFTDVEYLRDLFKHLVTAPTLTKRLLVIHGLGGVGKSSLLRMFRLHCKSANVPVALAMIQNPRLIVGTLDGRFASRWHLVSIIRENIQALSRDFRQRQTSRRRRRKTRATVADIASNTAEAAGGALAGAAIGSVIPGIGTAIGGALGGVFGGMGGEAFVDWMRGFLDQARH